MFLALFQFLRLFTLAKVASVGIIRNQDKAKPAESDAVTTPTQPDIPNTENEAREETTHLAATSETNAIVPEISDEASTNIPQTDHSADMPAGMDLTMDHTDHTGDASTNTDEDHHHTPESDAASQTPGKSPSETPTETDTAMSHDDHADDASTNTDEDHHHTPESDAASQTPGKSASSDEIAAYLETLFGQDEVHVHDTDDDKHDEHHAAMKLVAREDSTKVAIDSGDWFDPSIWADGEVPGDGDRVLIPEGATVSYGQESDTKIFTIRVDGKLTFETNQNSQLIFDTMVITPTGTLEIGTEENPIRADVNVDLIVADNGPIDTDWDPMLLSRGIISHGSAELHGTVKDSHEKVSEDPMAGDTSVKFAEAPEGWQVGDKIVIAGTHYDGYKWNNAARAVVHYEGQDEVRIITAIDGNTVYFDEALLFDHDSPRADLKTSVANYTRNVSIESENDENIDVSERGHVMFMHSDDVEVRYAEFHELGRTDKSNDSFQVGDIEQIKSDSNVQGRYALHLHRTGVDDVDDPTIIEGNAVWGSPGWGFVQHDSNALLSNNASFDTFGAGYVAETGNEIGAWTDNIAINAMGPNWLGPKATTKLGSDTYDIARGGDGFWFQGRLVTSTDNVASTVNHGFVYFHRNGNDQMLSIDSDHFAYADALNALDIRPDKTPILGFDGNETFASNEGLHVVKAFPGQGHDVWSHFTDFTAWNVKSGAHFEYTSHYLVEGFDLIAAEDVLHTPSESGISMGKNTSEIVITDSKIDGFTTGINLYKQVVSQTEEFQNNPAIHNYFVIDTDITNATQDFENYDSLYDTILVEAPVERVPQIELDGPLTFKEGWPDPGARIISISGTKTDSLGTTDFPGGMDNFDLDHFETAALLEKSGYWTTSEGQNYFLLDIYSTDRLTGKVYAEKHPVFLDENVPVGDNARLSGRYENAKFNGEQDIIKLNGVEFAGSIALGTPTEQTPGAHLNLPAGINISNILTLDHELMDEGYPHQSMMEDDLEQSLMTAAIDM